MQYLVLCLNGNDDRLLFQVPSMPLSQHNGDKKDNHIKNFAFIYRDDETKEIAVVYKRNDGGYGLIETE